MGEVNNRDKNESGNRIELFAINNNGEKVTVRSYRNGEIVTMDEVQFEKDTDKLEVILEEGKKTIIEIAELGEQIITDQFHMFTTCTKGCSHCCNLRVGVYSVEANIIRDYMDEMFTEGEKYRIMKKAQVVNKSKYHNLSNVEYSKLRLPCIFMKDNLCSIYEVRPWGCRRHFSVLNPQDCADCKERTFGLAYLEHILELYIIKKSVEISGSLGPYVNEAEMIDDLFAKGEGNGGKIDDIKKVLQKWFV